MVKINNNNIHSIKLEQNLSNFNSIGPIFEGMPQVRYSEDKVDWMKITKEISSKYASQLPFGYLD